MANLDRQEVLKFSQHANDWWDLNGPLRTLHHIQPVRLEYIKKHTALKGATVLDVGCGGGILAEGLAKEGAQVIGLDVEAKAIEIARVHAEASQLSIEYIDLPIEEYKHARFDVITCMEMLEHVPDPAAIIHHCFRLLKPTGLLFLSTINKTWKAYLEAIVMAEYVLGLLPKQTHDFEKCIKPHVLSDIVRKEGGVVTDLVGVGYCPWTKTAYIRGDVSVNYMMVIQR